MIRAIACRSAAVVEGAFHSAGMFDQAPHASFVRLAQLLGLVLHGSTMIVTELPLGHKRSVPVPLQRARYQPIVRIEALVAPPRQRGRVGGRLQPLFPLAMQLPAFEFEISAT